MTSTWELLRVFDLEGEPSEELGRIELASYTPEPGEVHWESEDHLVISYGTKGALTKPLESQRCGPVWFEFRPI